ncbi:hypothetical protein BJ170DRAFT_710461 [Xylariales sp. AK1849]|nr:hypothetical protein BJ170DRAFT_710461 [Xylariales sp. AK1849]
MEQHRLPRRSASHGILRSSYARHARPLHKPLRCVNENSALLPSPGALESMLKTTTETGDIGLFSIKPIPGSKLALSSGDNNVMGATGKPNTTCQSVDEAGRQDDRRKLPSYRDTTSEIISMYGSNSRSSVTSTLTPSMDEAGHRSYSMTTVGSRHLSHNKSSATLQSQSSYGPLQRPRSPFPYPTRLKRPGARPASPAVTDAGVVDYSRMVEIDRISLRTGHGPLKLAYPHAHRRLPPLGLRSDANLSTPSLPGLGPPPVCYPPVPPSIRTISAASVASWNAPHRQRLNSKSSRTSSLTSVINMYHRMPPALRDAQLGPPATQPRYYDYTEDFESKQPRLTTLIQPLAPVPTRALSIQRPLVLREGSEEKLAAAFGVEADSAFFDDESQQDESRLATQSEDPVEAEITDEQDDHKQIATKSQPTSSKSEENNHSVSGSRLGARKLTRGSDIDLLPSQVGRASVDTFRTRLDVESREIPLFSYPNFRHRTTSSTNTPSPARQVQVHGGMTPTIRSEQGVILRDDVQHERSTDEERSDDADLEEVKTSTILVQSPTKWRSKPETANELLHVSTDAKANESTPRCRITLTDSFNQSSSRPVPDVGVPEEQKASDAMEMQLARPTAESAEVEAPTMPPRNTRNLQHESTEKLQDFDTIGSASKDPDSSEGLVCGGQTQFRRHRRNHAALKILTKKLPQEKVEDIPELTPSCSTTPLIAPKPISPARYLKMKNSIPQLMKALPPLPGELGYVPPPTPTTMNDDDDDDEDNDYAEVLLPYNFSCSGTLEGSRGSIIPQQRRSSSGPLCKPLPDLQKKLPRIRVKSKGPDAPFSNPRGSRPWNSDSNYPWFRETPTIELADINGEGHNRLSLKRKLRLRGSRTVCGGTPPGGTVRWHPDARGSEIVADLASRQSKDLFSLPNGLSAVFREVSRKFSHGSHDLPVKGTPRSMRDTVAPSIFGRQSQKQPRIVLTAPDGRRRSSGLSSGREPVIEHRRGLKKRLSNIGWLLARSSQTRQRSNPTEETNNLHRKGQAELENTFGWCNINFEIKDLATSKGIALDTQHQPRFKRRMRTKIGKWMRKTKAAVKHGRRRHHGLEVA